VLKEIVMSLRRLLPIVLLVLFVACGKDSPTAPTPPVIPPTNPTPSLYSISGLVTIGVSATPVPNATVRVVDGPNAGANTTTDGSGRYTLNGLTFAGFSLSASAPTYTSVGRGVPLTSGVFATTANFSLLPSVPWSHEGTGNNVFDMPNYFTRVRVVGIYTGYSSNFIVHINGRAGFVNELLGTGWGQTRYDGVQLVNGGGVVEVLNSSGVSWSFTEER
jgi:hypothetical protein